MKAAKERMDRIFDFDLYPLGVAGGEYQLRRACTAIRK